MWPTASIGVRSSCVCYGLQVFCTTALLLLARAGVHGVYPIYAVLFFIGTARTFSGPANSALIPHLVPEEHFVNAVTWGATIFQFATIIGPALGGVLFTLPLTQFVPDTALQGRGHCVCLYAGARSAGRWCWWAACTRASAAWSTAPCRSRWCWPGFNTWARSPLLLGAASLDLFAVLLGGAVALTPIFANDILHTGPRGLGMLRAAPAAGRGHHVAADGALSLPPPCGSAAVSLRGYLWRGDRRVWILAAAWSFRWPRCLWPARQTPSA